MKCMLLIISVLIPLFSFLSTLLITYADRHKVPVNSFSSFNKAMKSLNRAYYNPSQAGSDTLMELNNRKMKKNI